MHSVIFFKKGIDKKVAETQDHYALQQLKISQAVLLQAAHDLPKLRISLEKLLSKDKTRAKACHTAMQKLKTAVAKTLINARLSLLEIQEIAKADKAQKLQIAVERFNLMTPSYEKLSNALTSFAEELNFNETVSAALIGRLMNNVKLGHYPTDLAHVEMLAKGLAFPKEKNVNIIDPCCGTGAALRTFCDYGNCTAYGTELDEARAELALDVLDRVGFGSYFHSRISRNAFHLLFLNPPYLSLIGSTGRTRAEKRFLVDSIDLLITGGVLMFIIPFYRLTEDLARVLCDNFSNLQMFRFENSEFEKWRQIVVIGTKKQKADGTLQANELMEKLDLLDEIPHLSALVPESYSLPDVSANVQLFKGAVFNEAELAEQLSRSNSLKALYTENELDNMQKRPMLPLNTGQIGLIGGSGLINGYADCEHPHIIKGRIVKETLLKSQILKRDRFGNPISTEQTETNVNKLIFNILTPQGFKSLN